MQVVEAPWNKIYKAPLFLFGLPFTLFGGAIYANNGNLAFLINGIFWICIGVGFKMKSTSDRRNLESLKRNGSCYEGKVTQIVPSRWLRIGSYITARVECVYETMEGDKIVMSGYQLLTHIDHKESLYAKIYFDDENTEKYMVELFRG